MSCGAQCKAELLCIRIWLWKQKDSDCQQLESSDQPFCSLKKGLEAEAGLVWGRSCGGLRRPLLRELGLTCAHGTQVIDKQMASPEEFIPWMLDEVYSWTWLPSDSLAARPTSGSNHGTRCWMASLITSLSLMTSSHLERSMEKRQKNPSALWLCYWVLLSWFAFSSSYINRCERMRFANCTSDPGTMQPSSSTIRSTDINMVIESWAPLIHLKTEQAQCDVALSLCVAFVLCLVFVLHLLIWSELQLLLRTSSEKQKTLFPVWDGQCSVFIRCRKMEQGML